MKYKIFLVLLTFLASCASVTPVNSESASSRINKSENNSREIFKELDE